MTPPLGHYDSWFDSEAHRAKDKVEPGRGPDSDALIWFVAPEKEQLVPVADNGFHGSSLVV